MCASNSLEQTTRHTNRNLVLFCQNLILHSVQDTSAICSFSCHNVLDNRFRMPLSEKKKNTSQKHHSTDYLHQPRVNVTSHLVVRLREPLVMIAIPANSLPQTAPHQTRATGLHYIVPALPQCCASHCILDSSHSLALRQTRANFYTPTRATDRSPPTLILTFNHLSHRTRNSSLLPFRNLTNSTLPCIRATLHQRDTPNRTVQSLT